MRFRTEGTAPAAHPGCAAGVVLVAGRDQRLAWNCWIHSAVAFIPPKV